MNPLQQIPAHVRTILYWTGYVFGVVGQTLAVVWAAVAASSPNVEMPLWLVVASAVIGLLTTQLNLLAGSNVTDVNAAGHGDRIEESNQVIAQVNELLRELVRGQRRAETRLKELKDTRAADIGAAINKGAARGKSRS